MNAIPRNGILIIFSVISRAFCAVSRWYLNQKKKRKKKDKMHLKRFYGDIANKRDR